MTITFTPEEEAYLIREPVQPVQEEEKPERKTQADILIELAKNKAKLFHSENEPFARIKVKGHLETWPVKSKYFRRWLAREYYIITGGKAPNNEAITQALNVIEAKAIFDGEAHNLELRVAEHDGAFYYDLADEQWRAVRVTPEGWEIVDEPPILFRRYKNTAPQVEPKRGKLDDIWSIQRFVNMKDVPKTDQNDSALFVIYLVTCLIPGIAHVISVFAGEKGAAKSTTQRVQRKLIDPAYQELTTIQRSDNELALCLAHNYNPSFDNLDNLQAWQSDILCCASTGGGISKRELYTDQEEVILSFLRCCSLNGINLVVSRDDILDRSLIFNLERIEPEDRKEEAVFWKEFEEARPYILGGLFDALAGAMKIYPSVKLDKLPRMADFCRWGYAVAEALGAQGETFLELYYQNIGKASEEALMGNPTAAAVVAFMNGKKEWKGTPGTLLGELEKVAEEERINTQAKLWPKAANVLSRRLKQVKSNLADAGITYEEDRTSSRRILTLEKIG